MNFSVFQLFSGQWIRNQPENNWFYDSMILAGMKTSLFGDYGVFCVQLGFLIKRGWNEPESGCNGHVMRQWNGVWVLRSGDVMETMELLMVIWLAKIIWTNTNGNMSTKLGNIDSNMGIKPAIHPQLTWQFSGSMFAVAMEILLVLAWSAEWHCWGLAKHENYRLV